MATKRTSSPPHRRPGKRAPANKGESCYDIARRTKLGGAVKRAPRDLSTNRRHFHGFGQ